MPWLLVSSALFAGLAFIVATIARGVKGREERTGMFVTTAVLAVVSVLMLMFACMVVVSTRNVGIVTSFGKPVGTLSNGLHWKLPWRHVSELSGTIQTDSQVGTFDASGKCASGTPVRLANNSTACADNTIRWRIRAAEGDMLYRDYQNDANIRDSLVTRELNATLNAVFAEYNPLSPGAGSGPNLADLSNRATTILQRKIGAQIEVENIIITIIHFDRQTQDKVNAYQSQVADTRIAEAKQQTATAEAQANRILADSVSRDPNVLVSKCLDMLGAGKVFPVGFECWPGGALPLTIPAR